MISRHNFRSNRKGIGTVFGMIFFILIVVLVMASLIVVLNQNTGLEQTTVQAKQLDLDRYIELQTVSINDPETAVLNGVVYFSCTVSDNGTLPVQLDRLWIRDVSTGATGNIALTPSITLQPGSSSYFFKYLPVAGSSYSDQFIIWFITARGNAISDYPNINQFNGITLTGTFPGVADINSTYQTTQNPPMQLSLKTTQPNQLIYLVVSYDDGNFLHPPISTPSLTWTLRINSSATSSYPMSGDSFLTTFYAIDPSVGPITISIASTADELSDYYCSALAFAISNVNTTSPFDGPPLGQAPQTSTGKSTTPLDTITTHYSNDMIIGALGIDALNPAITPGAGFAQIMPVQSSYGASGQDNAMPRSVWSEWCILNSSATNLPVNCAFTSTQNWAIILDAVRLVVTPPPTPVSLSPNSGPIGQVVTVTGQGFVANSQLVALFDSSPVPFSFRTDASGDIPSGATFSVPQGSTAGIHTVTVFDGKYNYANATFTVTTPNITLTPQTGPTGTVVTVTGSNFIDNSPITINFNGNLMATHPSSLTADATGSFSATFSASGPTPAGAQTVSANDGVNSAIGTFTITPSITTITPTSGLVGTQVTISGMGFAANSTLMVTFDGAAVSPPPTNAVTDANGTFSTLTFTAPSSSTPGAKIVNVTDSKGNFATKTFNLMFIPTANVPTLNPSASISYGSSVTASVTVSGVAGFTPIGTVQFQCSSNGGSTWTNLGSPVSLSTGSATSISYTPAAPGTNCQFRVSTYSGDTNYIAASTPTSAVTLIVTQTVPTTSTTLSYPSRTLGQSVTDTATVSAVGSGATPTGSITFYVSTDGGVTFNQYGAVKPLTSGSATSDAYTPTNVGIFYFRAVYNGDTNYLSSQSGNTVEPLTITQATATVSASSFTPSSPITLGTAVSVSVSVTGPSGVTAPTGNVQFQVSINSGSYANFGSPVALFGSAASISYTPQAVTTYNFRATYQGDSNYVSAITGAASGTLIVHIGSSMGTVLSASSPITLGGTTTDTATVTPQSYVHNQVTFVAADTGYGFTSTSAQSIAYPSGWQANDLLLLQITVRDTTNTPSTPSGFTLLYGPDSSTIGQQWIYYRFATGSDSGTVSVTIPGSNYKIVRMYDFRNVAASSFTEGASFNYNAGSTTISTQPVTTTGVNRLAVSFVFDTYSNALGTFSGGTWAEAVPEYVYTGTGSRGSVQLQTATMASAGTITAGSFTITTSASWGVRTFALIPSPILPSGTVNFQVLAPGGSWTTFNTQTLASGTATSTSYTPTSVGTWYFRAVYPGDSNYAGAQSGDGAESLIVNVATATVGAATFAPASPITLGTVETVSVSVTGPGGVTAPTGSVQFQVKIGAGAFANFGSPVALSGSSASISYTPQTLTTYQFQAVYLGDGNYVSGTTGAASGTLTVNKGTATVSASSFAPTSPISLGTVETVSASVSAPAGITITPTGSVQFQVKIGAGAFANFGSAVALLSGSASVSYTPQTATTYSFQAVYQGDTNYVSGTTGAASGTLTVNVATATVGAATFAPASPITLGTVETVSVSVTGPGGVTAPTGSVQFMVKIGSGSYVNLGSAVALLSGSASISYTPPSVTTYGFEAVYQGDSNYASGTTGAASGTLTVYGVFGNTNTGSSSQSLTNVIRGSPYVAPATGTLQSITAYISVGSTSRHIQAAIYTTSGTLLGTSNAVTGISGTQWVTFSLSTTPSLTAGTTYVIVLSADGSNVNLYYSGTSTSGVGDHTGTVTYGTWPTASFTADTYLYCIYYSYSIP